MKLSYFISDFDAPTFYRCLFPGRELIHRGHEIVMPPIKVGQNDKGHTRLVMHGIDPSLPEPDADIYVIQNPRQKEYAWITTELQKNDRIVVGESDDYDFDVPDWHPAFVGLSATNNPYYNREWTRRTFEQCDALQVSTPFLAEAYSKNVNAVVRCIPNYLDWGMWENVEPVYEQEFRKTRIGWMGAAYLRKGDLEVLAEFIGPWMESHPEVEFVAAGSPETHDLLGIPKGQRVSTTSVVFREGDLADITAVMDIGLVPLQMHPFNEAKSSLKGMEYAACGIPCIASPTTEYRSWVGDDNGRLAATAAEWIQHLDELVADSALRRQMGRAAREKARQFSIDLHVDEWEDWYAVLLGSHADRLRARRHALRVQREREEAIRARRASRLAGQGQRGTGPDAERANPFERV